MSKIIARQPILDKKNNTISYELLFRSIESPNKANFSDGNAATMSVIKSTLIDFGIKKISNNKKVFINFTKELILSDAISMLKKDSVVIELLENILDSEEVIRKIMDYKSKGYKFAIDDFVNFKKRKQILKLVDIVKIDFNELNFNEINELVDELSSYNKILLAEKVETNKQFEFAKDIGFSMFQGYYFLKPEILKSESLKSIPVAYTKLIQEINKEEIDFDNIVNIIKQDTSLTYSFLKIVNSVAYYSRRKISSVKDAFIRLGLKESKKIIYIHFLKIIMPEEAPSALIKKSLIRGRMAENLANSFNLKSEKEKLFLLGLFSLISVILKKDMEKLLENIPLENDIKEGLLGKKNHLTQVLDLIISNENNKMKIVEKILKDNNIPIDNFSDIYFETLQWADELF
ncbi:MAG: EAL and HDOD domain-containing protein [Bacillota bacterium]